MNGHILINEWLTDNNGNRVGRIMIQSKREVDKRGRNFLLRRINATYRKWCEDGGYNPNPEVSDEEIRCMEQRLEWLKKKKEAQNG